MTWGTWQPGRIRRVERVLGSSMRTVVVVTDQGRGYLKAIGNPEGEHALACDLIGSALAEWLDIPTLDFALLELTAEDEVFLDADESVPIAGRRRATAGPALITRGVTATTWSGDPRELDQLQNPKAIAGLVLLDTWLANPDRHPRRPPDPSLSTWQRPNLDNVLFVRPPRARRARLVAMDFSVCLYCRDGGLRANYPDHLVRDDGIYGLFPSFEALVTPRRLAPFLRRLGEASGLRRALAEIISRIPAAWQVEDRTRLALREFLSARAAWLADSFLANLKRVLTIPPSNQ